MGLFEDANTAAVESVAKKLKWVEHPAPAPTSSSRIGLFAPTVATSGVAILSRPKTMIHVPLREDPAAFASRVRLTTLGDDTTTYRVTINGTNVDHTPGVIHTAAEALDGIRDAINSFGAPVSTTVVASTRDTDEDGIVDEILIKNLDVTGVAEHTTVAAVTAGPGALAADEDLSTASFNIWGRMSGSNAPAAWVRARGGVFSSVDRKGLFERIDTAGLDRVYLELTASSAPTGGGTVSKIVASLATGVV